MGILEKVIGLFRKKPEISPETTQETQENTNADDLGMQRRSKPEDFEAPKEEIQQRDTQSLILTKLDNISLKLDNLDRRVQYIEKIAKESEK